MNGLLGFSLIPVAPWLEDSYAPGFKSKFKNGRRKKKRKAKVHLLVNQSFCLWAKTGKIFIFRIITSQTEGDFQNCFFKSFFFFDIFIFKFNILLMVCNREPLSLSTRDLPRDLKIMVLWEEKK